MRDIPIPAGPYVPYHERLARSYHECGHAVAAARLSMKIRGPITLDLVPIRIPRLDDLWRWRLSIFKVAGRTAEEVFLGEVRSSVCELEEAASILAGMTTPVRDGLGLVRRNARRILEADRDAVELLADHLYWDASLTPRQIQAALNRSEPTMGPVEL